MKTIYTLFIGCIMLLGCNSDNDFDPFKNTCSVTNPVEDLAWLKAEIEDRGVNNITGSEYRYISLSSSENEPVIIYANCNPLVNSIFVVLNCNGENIGFIGDDNFSIDVLTKGQIIWKPDDFVCTF